MCFTYSDSLIYLTQNTLKMYKKTFLAIIAMAAIFLTSCDSDDDSGNTPTPAQPGDAIIKLEHVWGESEEHFHLMDDFAHPTTGETLNFTKLKYYVSNIALIKSDGTEYVEDESYRLIDFNHENMEPTINLMDIPGGTYTTLRLTIGVDSTRNVSGAQKGALDPANGMFWNWNSGYIFVKAEGSTSATSADNFAYHIGGYASPNSAIRELEFDFNGAPLDIAPNSTPAIHLVHRVDKIWDEGTTTESTPMMHMPGPMASVIAQNFSSGFRFDHIHP